MVYPLINLIIILPMCDDEGGAKQVDYNFLDENTDRDGGVGCGIDNRCEPGYLCLEFKAPAG